MANTIISRIIEQLTTEHQSITAQLATLESDYKTKKVELTAQLTPLARMIAAAKGQSGQAVVASSSNGVKRVMSEAGKAAIRAGMEARKARLAEEAKGKAAETAAEAPAATEEQSAAVENTVKVTPLEEDVLVGGLLKNNYSNVDGDEHNGVWSEQIITNGQTKKVTPKQLPGVVASLVKKGLVVSDAEAVTLTRKGLELARQLEVR